MTNEAKKVPKLRFPEFDGEWEERVISDSVKILKSGLSRELSSTDIGLPVIRANNLQNYNLILDDIKYWYKEDPKGAKTENYYVEKNDILINFINSESKMGTSCIIKNDLERKYIYTTNILRYVTNETYDSYFHYFYTQTYNYKKWIKIITKPAVNQASFTTVDFKKIPYFIPKFKEQQKIGEFFSKLDRQIELEEQKLAKLEEQKKGYMQKIFSQELRFKDENGNEYPEWKERKFSELLSYSSNGVDKKINKNHDIAYMVNYMDVFKKTKLNTKNRDLLMEITATKIQKEKNNLKKGDILFTPSSETREDIAKSTVVFEDLDNTVYSYHLIRLRPLDSNIFSLKYSNYLSEQNFINKQFRRLAQGAQRYTLTKEYFENIKLNLPHIKEQGKIGDFFSKLDEVINKQSQKIDELKLRKQGFLQKMFV